MKNNLFNSCENYVYSAEFFFYHFFLTVKYQFSEINQAVSSAMATVTNKCTNFTIYSKTYSFHGNRL